MGYKNKQLVALLKIFLRVFNFKVFFFFNSANEGYFRLGIFVHLCVCNANDNLITHQKAICSISEPRPDSHLLSHNFFQLLEVPDLSHLKSASGTGNALTVQSALSHWWARDSSPGGMMSFVMNVPLLHNSVESCTAAVFSLCNDVLHYSAVRKPYKRHNSYLVIQVAFQQQFNSLTVLNCL